MSARDHSRPRSASLPLPKKEPTAGADQKEAPKLLFEADSCLPSASPSFNELRRSSFSGLTGLAGFAGLVSPNVPIGRTASEKVKSPKRQKKDKWTRLGEKVASDLSLDRLRDAADLEPAGGPLSHQNRNASECRSREMAPPRPKSAIGSYEAKNSISPREMQRGRSMPSLHLLLDRFGAGSPDARASARLLAPKSPKKSVAKTHVPFPIITVTEHSPATSVHFFVAPDADSPRESAQSLLAGLARPAAITRSQTDSNISYYAESWAEAPASTNYVTKSGQLSLVVVLKAVHAIALRDAVCSLHVCQSIHELLTRLLAMGALPAFAPPDAREADELSVHHLFLDTVTRLIKQLGCPHGCGEGHREEEAHALRRAIGVTLAYLFHASEGQFAAFFDEMVARRHLQEIMDVFHAFLGFCAENHAPAVSPQGRKQSNTPLASQPSVDSGQSRTGYSTNFGQGFAKFGPKGENRVQRAQLIGCAGIEGVVINLVFKALVSRLTRMARELRLQENLALYCEVRQLVAYVR